MNYDVVSSIIDYGISSCMRVDANDFPILMVENSFASKEDKYKVFFSECIMALLFFVTIRNHKY